MTALIISSEYGHVDVVLALLQHGANVNAATNLVREREREREKEVDSERARSRAREREREVDYYMKTHSRCLNRTKY